MKQTIDEFQFINAFMEIRPNNFTRAGLFALYNYLEEYEESTGEEIELDVIALCCEYTEYESIVELKSAYDHDNELEEIVDVERIVEYFTDRTAVITINKGLHGFIIQNF
jgi:hypothetical protein